MSSNSASPDLQSQEQAKIEAIFNNRGAQYEKIIFESLRNRDFVARSFEFSPVDGALACDQTFRASDSYADRLHILNTSAERPGYTERLVLFDVKGKRAGEAKSKATHNTSTFQHRQVAFYLCICAQNLDFVELVPNYHQDTSQPALPQSQEEKESCLYSSRASRLPFSTHGLDPTVAQHRMPIVFLPEALQRVRNCALDGSVYINPWTGARHDTWRPQVTTDLSSLRPHESVAHFSAYMAVMDIYRALRVHQDLIGTPKARCDIVGLAPRLADFKLILYEGPNARQLLIQHKKDSRIRSPSAPLDRVAIARATGRDCSYFFNDTDSFDFLFYEFDFADRSRGFFFIPEPALPDDFFNTHDLVASFATADLQPFWIDIDDDDQWVVSMLRLAQSYQPNSTGRRRPRRDLSKLEKARQPKQKPMGVDSRVIAQHARHRFVETLTEGQRAFYAGLMGECAKRRSGVLLPLAVDDDSGDFVYCAYRWSEAQALDRQKHEWTAPVTLSDMQGDTPVVPLMFFTRPAETSFYGPNLLPSELDRLNRFPDQRLVFCDLWGADRIVADGTAPSTCTSVTVIPSEDIRPTEPQRQGFANNAVYRKQNDRNDRTPHLAKLLNSGLLLTAYTVGARGESIFEQDCNWEEIWQLLDGFLRHDQAEHPPGILRDARQYRRLLSQVFTRRVQSIDAIS